LPLAAALRVEALEAATHFLEVQMRAPTFGLSTTPVADIKSELRRQIERDMLALVYGSPR
jgi:hypothetical protein